MCVTTFSLRITVGFCFPSSFLDCWLDAAQISLVPTLRQVPPSTTFCRCFQLTCSIPCRKAECSRVCGRHSAPFDLGKQSPNPIPKGQGYSLDIVVCGISWIPMGFDGPQRVQRAMKWLLRWITHYVPYHRPRSKKDSVPKLTARI